MLKPWMVHNIKYNSGPVKQRAVHVIHTFYSYIYMTCGIYYMITSLSISITHFRFTAQSLPQPWKLLQHPSFSYLTSPPPLITFLQTMSDQYLTVQICPRLKHPVIPSLWSISRNSMDPIEPTLSTKLLMHALLMASSRQLHA